MLSIVIPTLNEEKIIKHTINSLKSLSLPYEIIVSDGGSKDATANLAREAGAKVLVHSEARRQTIAEGRNMGGQSAAGDFIVFFDADCSIANPNEFFGKALKLFEENPKLVAIAPTIKILPENETFTDKLMTGMMNNSYRFFNNVFGFGTAPGEFQMVKREVFNQVGGYNKDLVTCEDTEFFNRLSRAGKVHFASDLVVYHTGRRIHKVGWPKMLSIWFGNTIVMMVRGKPVAKEWKPIR